MSSTNELISCILRGVNTRTVVVKGLSSNDPVKVSLIYSKERGRERQEELGEGGKQQGVSAFQHRKWYRLCVNQIHLT